MTERTCSSTPPSQSNNGDIWFNTTDKHFYIFQNIWHKIDHDTVIIEDIYEESLEERYDRAMGIL